VNVFADRLFAILLGWTGVLFNGIWNLVTNNSAGVSGFLQRFWLPLILILLVFGTVFDYVIWLIRWRPYFVWRTWFRTQDSRRRLNVTRHYMEDLDHAPLDLPEYQEGQFIAEQTRIVDEPVFFNFTSLPQQADEEILQDAPILWTSILPSENPAYQPAVHEYDAGPVQPRDDQYCPEPSVYEADMSEEAAAYPAYTGLDELFGQGPFYQPDSQLPESEHLPGASSRRRRTGSRRHRSNILRTIRDSLFSGGDSNATYDSLPAAVDQDDAFHKPYYPQNYNYKQNPGQPRQNEDTTKR
jgi:hypothetical protein